MSNRDVYWIWITVGAIAVGKGLHKILTPEFYSANPNAIRLSAAVYTIVGVCFLIVGLYYYREKKSEA
jgi:hypothetical protein